MFVFHDQGGRELSLRPEGTAGVVRAYIEHGLYKLAQPVKMWYMGPMFRHERQQKGRYRQHVQIGTEVLGSSDPLVDVEVISLLYAIHQALGVRDEVVYLNNLGDLETRAALHPGAATLPPRARVRARPGLEGPHRHESPADL
jgi:histidyl-tRNA synthetase